MATRKHNLRVVTSKVTEAPKSVQEELHAIEADFLDTISLLEVLRRAVNDDDEQTELWASLGIAINHFHNAYDRLDVLGIRISPGERAPDDTLALATGCRFRSRSWVLSCCSVAALGWWLNQA